MRTIRFMSDIPNSPDLIILRSTHPTPFPSTSNWPCRTFNMITPIHFLNPATAITWFGIRFKPNTRRFVSGEKLITSVSPIFHTSNLRVSRSATIETGFKLTCRASEIRNVYQVSSEIEKEGH